MCPYSACNADGACSVTSPNSTVCPKAASDDAPCECFDGGAGVAADYILYVTAKNTGNCGGDGEDNASEETLAYAGNCIRDSVTDRPIVGHANFCPKHVKSEESAQANQIETAVHELAHALGFEGSSIAYFRDESGAPRTARDPHHGHPMDVELTAAGGANPYFTCPANGATYGPGPGKVPGLARPSADTLKLEVVRGKLRAKLATPKVLAMAREMFACDTLDGVELENDDPNCFGSHWEERLFGPLVQTAVTAGYGSVFSPLTLAYFEDSGWYRANYSSGLTRQTPWGYHAGCSFVDDQPIGCTDAASLSTAPPTIEPFCNVAGTIESRCSADHTHKSQCISGGAAFDGCTFWSAASYGTCINAAGGSSTATKAILGEMYGSSSRCVRSTLRQAYTVGRSTSTLPNDKPPGASCFQTACITRNVTNSSSIDDTETVLAIKVIRHFQEKAYDQWLVCERDGQVLELQGFKGELTCPAAADICGSRSGVVKPYLEGLGLGLESGETPSVGLLTTTPVSEAVPCGNNCDYSNGGNAGTDSGEGIIQKIIENWMIVAAAGGGLFLVCLLCCCCSSSRSKRKPVGGQAVVAKRTQKTVEMNPIRAPGRADRAEVDEV
jgi:leishmanolysin-like peptidase